MELVYVDEAIVVCVKPAGAASTNVPGGVPELAGAALGVGNTVLRTVHRLDQVVGGLMVLARTAQAASELSRQIREREFQKEYLAVVHGTPAQPAGTMRDLLYRDKARRMTLVVGAPGKGVAPAELSYRVVNTAPDRTRVWIALHTGRTHQIRVQFASRGMPLVGERKYSVLEDGCPLALWSYRLAFSHPVNGKAMEFQLEPPQQEPWKSV